MGLRPHVLIGDLDSVSAEYLDQYRSSGGEIKQYPVAKDATDLELALQHAISLNPATIVIAGATGSRFDHTLANVMLVNQPGYKEVDISLDDGTTRIELVKLSLQITGCAGDIISLIPLSEKVTGISTTGMLYPLSNEEMNLGETRGVSNVMTSDIAQVKCQTGILLCIHTRLFDGG